MSTSQADDTRGILFPGRMMQHVDFARYPASPALDGLIDWFWSVRWSLPAGIEHRQDVVAQPGVNISIGNSPPPGPQPPEGPYAVQCLVNGVTRNLTTRVLRGQGWNLAAKTATGGFGAWVEDVAALTDRIVPAIDVLPGWSPSFGHQLDDTALALAVEAFDAELVRLLEHAQPGRVEAAREVAGVARAAEHDRTIQRVEQLTALAGVSTRTLQRLFSAYAGVSPTWVIRRFRLLQAAERVSGGEPVDWASVAAELGYADQAHLTREFTATIGLSPAAYARAQRSGRPGQPETNRR